MDPPHFLLEALNDSIVSGTFIDTKFYVFSRREASGRVGSPRALYCSSRVLNTVPYFSTLFSDASSEGQTRDIDGGFPSDSQPYTEYYDYLSDSDLEDDPSCFEEEEEESSEDGSPKLPHGPHDSDSQPPPTVTSEHLPHSPSGVGEIQNDEPVNDLARMGKVVIIRDMAAVTFEAMVYFLYTGKIGFAPFSSDSRHELLVEARSGDWSTVRLPHPSAKSIYRLADKYDIPTLKQLAKAYIYENLAYCNIVDEVFSGFSLSFPEILSVQVPRLVSKMKEEPKGDTDNITKKQLRHKITALPQSQLARATDALAMIWDGVMGPLDLPPPELEPKPTVSAKPPLFPNWHRLKIALFKSILTGTFIDVQLYAYNTISNGLPLDSKALFTSSIVIEQWGPAITTQTVGTDSQVACLTDGLTDDYECWYGELSETHHKAKAVLKYRTKAAAAESCEVVMLMSGAWKTWMSLLSYAYTNEMTFAPLQTSTRDGGPVADAKVQQPQQCSPRSMYSLATALGIKNIEENALSDIRSKLSTSNITQELFTSFAASHKTIMDMEIQFFHENFTKKNPKLLMDHIRRMGSGQAPFFSATLGLVYDKLVEKKITQSIPSSSTPEKSTDNWSVTDPVPPLQVTSPTSSIDSSPTFGTTSLFSPQAPAPILEPVPSSGTDRVAWLKCIQCGEFSRLQDLYDGLRCPLCPPRGTRKPHLIVFHKLRGYA
ncbi:hypothetical protein BDM02DRAFT_3268320 [Thelephora ganbajun]|uniref:Uncharacterized protein n=1 Tax=Thelephora ganbajun TaxID=370292 RepID=A0ACB6ZK68_THEGA|nr:hypothetical protein BDM02DRAFT_3268320 [Thelephora ganbajun]